MALGAAARQGLRLLGQLLLGIPKTQNKAAAWGLHQFLTTRKEMQIQEAFPPWLRRPDPSPGPERRLHRPPSTISTSAARGAPAVEGGGRKRSRRWRSTSSTGGHRVVNAELENVLERTRTSGRAGRCQPPWPSACVAEPGAPTRHKSGFPRRRAGPASLPMPEPPSDHARPHRHAVDRDARCSSPRARSAPWLMNRRGRPVFISPFLHPVRGVRAVPAAVLDLAHVSTAGDSGRGAVRDALRRVRELPPLLRRPRWFPSPLWHAGWRFGVGRAAAQSRRRWRSSSTALGRWQPVVGIYFVPFITSTVAIAAGVSPRCSRAISASSTRRCLGPAAGRLASRRRTSTGASPARNG